MKGSVFLILLVGVMMAGCATVEIGRNITPEEITWIQKKATTRSEVVEKLGLPTSEMPDWTKMEFSSTSTTKTTTTSNKEDDGQTQKSVSTTSFQTNPTNKFTRALYIHTKSSSAIFAGTETHQKQFWLLYDAQGIVQDFGFAGGTSMTIH